MRRRSSNGGGNTPSTPTLQSVAVTPATPTINLGKTAPTQQFKATGSYSDGTTKDLTATANWVSSNGGVATINTSGMATGVAVGNTTISASSGGVSGNTTLTVANPLVSIAVTPQNQTINPVSPGNTLQFKATGTFADASQQDITTSASWQSSNSGTATVSSPVGLATAVFPGGVTITASMSGINGSTSLTVANPLQSITVTPANSAVAPGTKPLFTATGTYFDKTSNNITTLVAWNSSNLNAATISNSPGT